MRRASPVMPRFFRYLMVNLPTLCDEIILFFEGQKSNNPERKQK